MSRATLRRSTPLARDVHGPRAILNAVERLIGSAAAERDKARRDLEIAQGQLRDYEARLGAGFPHATYLEALTGLRTQLEAALSSTTHEEAEGSLPTVGDLVERLKALHAAHTVEAAPERSAPRRTATVEEAITTRIRQREQAETAPQPHEEAVPGGSRDPCTAACHHTAAAGHAGPGTPGTLAASTAVAPVLGTGGGGVSGATSLPPSPLGAVRIAGAPGGPGVASPPCRASWRRRAPPWASSRIGESATERAVARPEEPYGRRRVAPRGVTGTPPAGERRGLVPERPANAAVAGPVSAGCGTSHGSAWTAPGSCGVGSPRGRMPRCWG